MAAFLLNKKKNHVSKYIFHFKFKLLSIHFLKHSVIYKAFILQFVPQAITYNNSI